MPFITSKSQAQEISLYYEDLGSGKPLVFIHGWPSTHEMWEYQLCYFADNGYRVIAYDRRGFGKSFKPWNGYDYNTLADDLKLVLDELNLTDVTLVGFSMGGGEVARYCSKYNCDRINKIVLVSAVLPFMLKTADNTEGIDKDVFDGMAASIKEDRPAFLVDFGKKFFGETLLSKPVSEPFANWAHSLTLQTTQKPTLDCANSFSSTDFRDDLKKIKVPTLIIHGTDDKTVPIEASSDRTAKMITGAIYKTYDGAPHGLFYTHRKQLNEDIEEFLMK
jgi:non-heme chloroperoxidase